GTPLFENTETHWWDASQIYGSNSAKQQQVRSLVDGKLRLEANNLLPCPNGVDETGFNGNWWLGLSMFHNLFTLEHNSICDMLKSENHSWTDEQLFQTARMINAALIAKIHTLEWTTAL